MNKHIYYISTNNEEHRFDAACAQKYLDALTAYAGPCDEPSAKEILDAFIKDMTVYGAAINKSQDDSCSFAFENARYAKNGYFTSWICHLKRNIDRLSAQDLMRAPVSLDSLTMHFGDYVVLKDDSKEVLLTMDEFIRRLESNVVYYLAKRIDRML